MFWQQIKEVLRNKLFIEHHLLLNDLKKIIMNMKNILCSSRDEQEKEKELCNE